MFTTNFLGRNGALVERLEAQIATQESDRAVLTRELGTCDPQQIIARIRALEKETPAGAGASFVVETPASGDENELTQLTNPREMMEKVRSFNNRIQDLNSTVAGMEAQLIALYEEKEGMEREIGAGDMEGILNVIQEYKVTIVSMEQQLMTMYSARETLESEIGTSDAHRIVTLFRNVSELVGQIQGQMKSVDSLSLPAAMKPSATRNDDLPRVTPALQDVLSVQKKVFPSPNEQSDMPRAAPAVAAPVAAVTATPAAAAPAAAAVVAPVAAKAQKPAPLSTESATEAIARVAAQQRSVSPVVAAAAAAFVTAAAASAASAASVPATGKGQLAPDDPEYDPLSNPNDPLNDDSLINGTP